MLPQSGRRNPSYLELAESREAFSRMASTKMLHMEYSRPSEIHHSPADIQNSIKKDQIQNTPALLDTFRLVYSVLRTPYLTGMGSGMLLNPLTLFSSRGSYLSVQIDTQTDRITKDFHDRVRTR
jgi:hypothetical protein